MFSGNPLPSGVLPPAPPAASSGATAPLPTHVVAAPVLVSPVIVIFITAQPPVSAPYLLSLTPATLVPALRYPYVVSPDANVPPGPATASSSAPPSISHLTPPSSSTASSPTPLTALSGHPSCGTTAGGPQSAAPQAKSQQDSKATTHAGLPTEQGTDTTEEKNFISLRLIHLYRTATHPKSRCSFCLSPGCNSCV